MNSGRNSVRGGGGAGQGFPQADDGRTIAADRANQPAGKHRGEPPRGMCGDRRELRPNRRRE